MLFKITSCSYLKNTHKNPNFGKGTQFPRGNSQWSSLVGTCLTLPNLGFLWVFFKYPKISENGNLLFFPVNKIKFMKFFTNKISVLPHTKNMHTCTSVIKKVKRSYYIEWFPHFMVHLVGYWFAFLASVLAYFLLSFSSKCISRSVEADSAIPSDTRVIIAKRTIFGLTKQNQKIPAAINVTIHSSLCSYQSTDHSFFTVFCPPFQSLFFGHIGFHWSPTGYPSQVDTELLTTVMTYWKSVLFLPSQ